jgi:hypothetical protein
VSEKLTKLSRKAHQKQSVSSEILELVTELRRADPPASWAKIGGALGVSAQAAWRKYRNVNAGSGPED